MKNTEESIVLYNDKEHYDTLCTWMQRHDLQAPNPKMLSDFGMVVNKTAIGFLFMTNSKTAYIDNIVTNPVMKSQERHIALNLLLKNLEFAAKKNGYKLITVLSNQSDMDVRLFSLGFRSHGAYSLYYKEIGEV